MASDGYTQHMVQAFHTVSLTHTFSPGRALKNWFVELDVDWVLGPLQRHLKEASAYLLQKLVESWIRALTVIVATIDETLVTTVSDTPAVASFATARVSAMLVFVVAVVQFNREENLQVMLQMYLCVCSVSYARLMMHVSFLDSRMIFNMIGEMLDREGNKLIESICNTMVQVRRTLMKDDDSWVTKILDGGGEVHKNTRLMVDDIVLMSKVHASTQNSAQSHNTEKLRELIDYTIDYLNNLLLRKSELCSDPSLRYLFLLNNSYFIVQMVSEISVSSNPEQSCGYQTELKLTPQCEKYMDSYLDVSWGNVLSFIPKSNSHEPLGRWIHTTSLAKFQSAFHNTYQAQKFWKVPEPRLRSLLRETITKRVFPVYNDYLKEHPELEKCISDGSSSPKVMEEMLGELFEG
uniref:Exocyst subunit Exo70 family protein n=1 Tax=Triticum urartu TaxID=4572 RepID=A0A8R7TNU1_TRIUA